MLAFEHTTAKEKESDSAASTASPATERTTATPALHAPLQRKAQCACGGQCPRCAKNTPQLKTQLNISQPGDRHEQEADSIAGQVMRMPAPEAAARPQDSAAPAAATHAPSLIAAELTSAGQPLNAETRAFFEPRFGRDFSDVRIHADAGAAKSARDVSAKAYTVGSDIVFNEGQYHPHTETGRSLLAHELVHVVQQGSASALGKHQISRVKAGTLQRQTIGAGCAGQTGPITAAWRKATGILAATIRSMENIEALIKMGGNPREIGASQVKCIETSFGDVGGLDGQSNMTLIGTVIEKLKRISTGFSGGKTLRCDPQTVGDGNQCDWRSAFVVDGNSTDIFLCPPFLDPNADVTVNAVTLIHEMAHSVLKVGHQGLPERTFPPTFFDYNFPLGLDFEDALKNAFAYEILANCLHGNPPTSEVKGDKSASPKSKAQETGAQDSRWSVGAAGGISVTGGGSVQGLAGIVGRLSLRAGDTVIFNPYIGLNVLYSPTTEAQPQGFVSVLPEIGLRIQKPLTGPYLDISAGGFLGAEVPLDSPTTFSGGVAGSLGFGWRWQRIEVGPSVTGTLPLGDESDPKRVIVLTKIGGRF